MMPKTVLILIKMTRFRLDQFSKQYLEELLSPLGEIAVGKEVLGESREVDVWFTPNPQHQINPQSLGLLGRFAQTQCILEPYSKQPTPTEVRDCLLKLFLTQAQLQRQSKRNDASLREENLPRVWILATSASEKLLSGFRAQSDSTNWPPGIYFLADFLRAAIVAINQLPCTEETLWLRILGKGSTQQQAITELIAMPRENLQRSATLELLANWRINIEISNNDSDDEAQELIMQLSPAYLKWREETLQEGKAEGKAEALFEVAVNLFKNGMTVEQVVRMTGLSLEQVQRLAREAGDSNAE
jgi:predicted HTH domain antitoxin